MKTLNEIKQGCGKEVNVIENEEGFGDLICCGEYLIRKSTGKRVLQLCPSCQALLTQTEEIIGEIEKLEDRYNKESYYRNTEKQFSIIKDLQELRQKIIGEDLQEKK